jgi:hypothetical protein
MTLRRSFIFAPLLLVSALAACGGSIESPRENTDPTAPGGRSGGSPGSGGAGGGGNTCTAVPACDPGDAWVANASGCAKDDARCYSRSACGATIWCTGATEQCAAYPSCPPDYVQVPSCLGQGTPGCVKVTVCGATIACQPDTAQCDGYPNCNPGDTQVASSSQCLQDDAVCYQRTTCGVSIWCTGPSAPDAGPPPPGKPPVP